MAPGNIIIELIILVPVSSIMFYYFLMIMRSLSFEERTLVWETNLETSKENGIVAVCYTAAMAEIFGFKFIIKDENE